MGIYDIVAIRNCRNRYFIIRQPVYQAIIYVSPYFDDEVYIALNDAHNLGYDKFFFCFTGINWLLISPSLDSTESGIRRLSIRNWKDYLRFSPLRGSQEIYKKGVRPTIKITRDEAHYLASNGFRWHSSIMHTWSKRKHYYACENRKVLEALEAYRQSQKKD